MNEIKYSLQRKKLTDLKPYHANPRTLSEDGYQYLKKSIEENGMFRPPVVNRDNVIMSGHQTVQVLMRMGWDEVECEVPQVLLTDKQVREIIKAANISAGKWDKEKIANEWDITEFDQFEIEAMNIDLDLVEPEVVDSEKDDEVPTVAHDPVTRRGDVWLLGDHRVMCGDSTMIDDVEKLMNCEKADMVFTDPPYNIASDSKNFAADKSKSMNDLKNAEWDKNFDIKEPLVNAINYSKDSCTYYVWTSQFLIQDIWDVFGEYCDFSSYLVWSKPNPMPSLSKRHPTWNSELCAYGTRGSKRTVNFPKEGHFLSVREVTKKSDGSHPTQKPLDLIEPLIKFSSSDLHLVMDLFLGSGSTLIACEKTNRKCYGMELDEHYCDVIVKRWQDYTGKQAKLEQTGETFEQLHKKRLN